MASIRDLAKFSAMAYYSNQIRYGDWAKVDRSGDESGLGFSASLFLNVELNEAVLAFRGTDGNAGDKSDFLANAEIAIRRRPHQLLDAEKAYTKALDIAGRLQSPYTLYLTGHSLGGALASLLSADNGGLPTVTFNSPGMRNVFVSGKFYSNILTLLNMYDLASVKKDKMLHIRSTGDVISRMTGSHIGKRTGVYVDNWGKGTIASRIFEQHSIENMFNAMANIPWTLEDLGW
ncbi:MAG: DUF2974 domain-containing protein [Gammaproteobacteria bacterium]|nr:DUF2974 domain-containing protein [Gammaproteobacteria bacterium]